jgi:hypothetical protein
VKFLQLVGGNRAPMPQVQQQRAFTGTWAIKQV